ncbi:MAG: hypothetical protein E7292_12720 [Lachnospiraceae bacterium]|nr:hypothetical protein [Lachnospiraceae bacterium]
MNTQPQKTNGSNVKNVKKYMFEKCDSTDYAIAVMAGVIAGFVDVVFVGKPGESILGTNVDKLTDNVVIYIANYHKKMNNQKGDINNISSAIRYFEKNYEVNYDQKLTAETYGLVDNLTPSNHHYKSLGHAPDLFGLLFSVVDQFNNTATFMSDGQIISINTHGSEIELRGNNFISKIFCGICNWFFHIMSDVAGSTSSRNSIGEGRGKGVSIPGMELFNMCNFGSFNAIKTDGKKEMLTLAQSMVKVYENGYDLRFGATMAIPVVLQDLLIRVLWVIRARYDKGRVWKECIPNSSHGDLRIMLITGDATLCIIDGLDAAIRSGGDFIQFVLRLNYIAWYKLIKMVIKEVTLRCEFSLEYLELELKIIDEEIQEYIRKLDNIDMEYVEQELESLHEMNVLLLETKDDKEFTEILYQSLEISGIKLQFHSHETFLKFMENDETLLL